MPKVPNWVFALLAILLFSAIRVDIMDIDAAQYAEMSREMAISHDWLHLYDRGINYLDKPPFLFWVSSLSIRMLGATNLGYRLPSILFAFWAIYATYRLTKKLYDENTGRMAALILGTCQGVFLMTNDVRCDTILMSWVITAIWMIREAQDKRKWYYVLGGTASIAFGMMTKGPIALMVPAFCFGSEWVLKRQWKNIFNPAHLLDIVLIAIFLIPMSIGLYQQYDIHPEKMMEGHQNMSGVKFFFWTQSFGRITGENRWDNGADISFLLVNMLWAFLPWIFLFLPALVVNVRELILQKFRLRPDHEFISTGGFILAYLSLGMSHYQLPHYIFVAFPLAAIMTAKLLRDFLEQGKYQKLYRVMKTVMYVAGALLWVGVLLILTITFPAGWVGILLWAVSVAIWIYIITRKQLQGKILWTGAAAIMLVNVFLTHHFYYTLLHYQVGTVAGNYIREHHIPQEKIMTYRVHDPLNSLHFYARQAIRVFENGYLPAYSGDYVLTQDEGLKDLQQRGYQYDIALQGQLFKVSELTPDFLASSSRCKATSAYYLVKIK
ncbi:glycosyltransferase family 39 protein [Chitinophagaceae bacterium MMS25-I14]